MKNKLETKMKNQKLFTRLIPVIKLLEFYIDFSKCS